MNEAPNKETNKEANEELEPAKIEVYIEEEGKDVQNQETKEEIDLTGDFI